jgi:hypothetical protein
MEGKNLRFEKKSRVDSTIIQAPADSAAAWLAGMYICIFSMLE